MNRNTYYYNTITLDQKKDKFIRQMKRKKNYDLICYQQMGNKVLWKYFELQDFRVETVFKNKDWEKILEKVKKIKNLIHCEK